MADSGLQDAGNGWVLPFEVSPGASRLSESVELQLTESIINGAENAVPNTPQHNAGELSADPSTEPAGAKKVKPRFEGLKTEMDRETEKSLNVMVVGESGCAPAAT